MKDALLPGFGGAGRYSLVGFVASKVRGKGKEVGNKPMVWFLRRRLPALLAVGAVAFSLADVLYNQSFTAQSRFTANKGEGNLAMEGGSAYPSHLSQLSIFFQWFRGGARMAATTFDTDAFDRATDGLLQFFTRQQAEALVGYRGDQALRLHIETLAERHTEGELTEAERAEYEGYVRANKFIATLQAKARQLLARE